MTHEQAGEDALQFEHRTPVKCAQLRNFSRFV